MRHFLSILALCATLVASNLAWGQAKNATDAATLADVQAAALVPMGFGVASVVQNTTTYLAPGDAACAASPNCAMYFQVGGTISNLKVRAQTAPAAGQTYTFTVSIGTAGTLGDGALTCQITNGSTNAECTDTNAAHNMAITAGQALGIKIVTSATSGSTGHLNIGWKFTAP